MDDIDEQEKLQRLIEYISRYGTLPEELEVEGEGEEVKQEYRRPKLFRSLLNERAVPR